MMPRHDSFEFAIRHILGIPVIVTRHSVPSTYGGPGDWQWSRWRIASFGDAHYANEKLRELNKPNLRKGE